MARVSAESLKLDKEDAIKTYRYLRIGMIGAVVALGVSILIEWTNVHPRCLQTSISAYYYTPVRAVFVGSMIVVGFALIVYKGRGSREDFCLNFAGIFAPVVAIAPTTSVGECWSRPPHPRPVFESGTLAPWLVANINNNFRTLLWTGLGGLTLSFILVVVVNWKNSKKQRGSEKLAEGITAPITKVPTGTWVSLLLTTALLLIGWASIRFWDNFYTLAHGYAAVLFFIFLWLAIVFNVMRHWKTKEPSTAPRGSLGVRLRSFWDNLKKQDRLFTGYALVAFLMAAGFILIPTIWRNATYKIFWLEAWEIALFAVYWIVQTAENWDEDIVAPATAPTDGSQPSSKAPA